MDIDYEDRKEYFDFTTFKKMFVQLHIFLNRNIYMKMMNPKIQK